MSDQPINGVVGAKKKGSGRSRNLGKLKALLDMPLDIISEVTGYLVPLDILHLSRVSKHFRELFNPYKNRLAWVAARRNIPGLPDCPADLNEGKYAAFVFEHHCQACEQRAGTDDYALYLRLCQTCHMALVKTGSVILRELKFKPKDVPPGFWLLHPRSWPFRKPKAPPKGKQDKFFQDEFENSFFHYLELLKSRSNINAGQILAERRAVVQKRYTFAEEMADWRRSIQKHKWNTKRTRSEDIRNRLRSEHGWTDEMFHLASRSENYHSLLNQPRALTERIFQNVKKEFDVMLADQRLMARYNEFEKIIIEVIDPSLSHRDFPRLPLVSEIIVLPEAVRLIEENESIDPITAERIRPILPKLIPMLEGVSLDIRRSFLQELDALDNDITPPQVSNEVLLRRQANGDFHRARFIFQCSPDVRRVHSLGNANRCNASVNIYGYLSHSRLPGHKLTVNPELSKQAAALLARLDLPKDARVEATKVFEKRLRCTCFPSDIRQGLGFYEMIVHFQTRNNAADQDVILHMNDSEVTTDYIFIAPHDLDTLDKTIDILPKRLPDLDEQSVIDALAGQKSASLSVRVCNACSQLTQGKAEIGMGIEEQIEYHMRTRHGIEGGNLDEHLIYRAMA